MFDVLFQKIHVFLAVYIEEEGKEGQIFFFINFPLFLIFQKMKYNVGSKERINAKFIVIFCIYSSRFPHLEVKAVGN